MTTPRRILPGTTYLVTRRCTQRLFLLVPRGKVPDLVGYCLALAASRHSIQVHAACCLSNHHHAIVTDPHGRVSEFVRDFHSLVARSINATRGRWENLWASGRTSIVALVDAPDTLDKAAYTLSNAVAAGLVEKPAEWPGFRTCASDVHRKPRRFKRPARFFAKDGPCPEEVELPVTVPPAFAAMRPSDYVSRLQAAIDERVAKAAASLRDAGRSVLGERSIKAQSPESKPATPAPRRRLSPEIACLDPERRKLELALLVAFRRAYAEARASWLRGAKKVLFPLGTYLLSKIPGVKVDAAEHPPDALAAAA